MDYQEERLLVWDALSELFLDTELSERDVKRLADGLAQSPYSIAELKDILYFEVYPACKWNLLSVAGEWAFFDRKWIIENIGPRHNKRPWLKVPPVRQWMFRDHWQPIIRMINSSRA